MITFIQLYWNKISNLGIHSKLNFLEQQKIRLVNEFSLLAIIVFLFGCLFFVWTSNVIVFISAFYLLLGSIPIYLQSIRRYNAARIIFLLIHSFFGLNMGFIFGEVLQIEYVFLFIPILSLFLLNKQTWIFVIVALFNYLIAEYYYTSYEPFVQAVMPPKFIQFFVYTASLLLIYSLVKLHIREFLQIIKLNDKHLETIQHRNQALESNKSLLEQRNADLEQIHALSEKHRNDLLLVANYSPAGIAFINKDLEFQFVNKTYESWYKLPQNSMEGQPISAIWFNRKVGRFMDLLDPLKKGRSFTVEFLDEFNEKDYKYIICQIVPRISSKEQFEGVFIFCQDITALKEKEITLTQVNDYLEAEVRERKKTEQKLRIANRELQEFAHATSHDIKEPLRMITNYSNFLKKELQNNTSETVNLYLNYIQQSSAQLSKMIKDLLAYATMDNALEEIEIVDLNKTMVLVQNNLRLRIHELNAQLNIAQLPKIRGHQTLMVQLFQNIIANGLKFRTPATTPSIIIDYQEQENYHQISITDNGIGIPEKHQGKIFRIFNRLHSQADYEGSGIGLATCKKIVEKYGGKIWLKSQERQGTTFFFTLPKSTENY